MKKYWLFVVLAILMMAVASVSADYSNYDDVISDVQKLLKDPIDASWDQSFDEVLAIAESLDGFVCSNNGAGIACDKDHWSGYYMLDLYFEDSKLCAVDVTVSAWNLMDLNYTVDSTNIPVLSQLESRLLSYYPSKGMLSGIKSIFPMEWSFVISPAMLIGDSSCMQAGFVPKSEGGDVFWLEFIFTSRGFAEDGTFDVSDSAENTSSAETETASDVDTVKETYTETCDSPSTYAVSYTRTCIIRNSKGQEAIDPDRGYSRRIMLYEQKYPGSNEWVPKETGYFDPEGDPVIMKNGYSYSSTEYSNDGSVRTVKYLDADKNPVNTTMGYHGYSEETSADGLTVTYTYFDVDGNPALEETDGYAYAVRTYTVDKSESTQRFYDRNDQLVTNQKIGVAMYHHFYNAEGRVTRVDYLDMDGELVNRTDTGYSTMIYEYDVATRTNSVVDYLDKDGNHVGVTE